MAQINNYLDITLDENVISQMVEELLEKAEEPIESLVKESDEVIKQAAQNFLQVLNFEEKNLQILKNCLTQMKKFKKANKSKDGGWANESAERQYSIYSDQVSEIKNDLVIQKAVKNIYKAGLAFQDIANKAIGQDPQVVITTALKKENASYKISLRELLESDITHLEIGSRGGISLRINTSYATLEEKANDLQSSIEKLSSNDLNDQRNLNKVYAEAIRRFEKYKGISSKSNKKVGIILWNLGKWLKMTPSAAGDITEAYNAYLLGGEYKYGKMTGDINHDMDILMHLVEEIDNARGRLIGDISTRLDENLSIEYAIKSTNASLQSYKQIEELAKVVLGQKNKVSGRTINKKGTVRERLKRLKEIDNKIKSTRNKIENMMEDEIIETVNGTMINYIKEFQ